MSRLALPLALGLLVARAYGKVIHRDDEDEDEENHDQDNSPWREQMVIAHAILCALGFLLFIPAGVLWTRWSRTFTKRWFLGHWILQGGFAGLTIAVGFGLGVASVSKSGHKHFTDTHHKLGLALVILYLVQCCLGCIVHYVRPAVVSHRASALKPLQTSGAFGSAILLHPSAQGRGLQNYAHVLLGLLTLGLAFWQVRLGYHQQWEDSGDEDWDLNEGDTIDIVWDIWVVVVPLAYGIGLWLLPRQFRQEAEARKAEALLVQRPARYSVLRDQEREEQDMAELAERPRPSPPQA
ncbi:hypothetical protein CYLTODRAFT_418062 [Cylindrobasidium torrendii FP15055 ss-10]|uniref:Cytochrome b561 domain-containing protein n=1 Tax=Cylindrobasidium torrendii FP15055 ss-10 TaxID=1314674 RepID=A0A0D7BPZ4_9AGAR|nr:hypothetical protein CYLTODRAFT_418062 [Cylindrobasidium torrendii FP15055 ss-10]